MNTKLTLRLDENLISKAKIFAEKTGKSLSQIVSEYFAAIVKNKTNKEELKLGPISKQLYGVLADTEISEKNYKRYIEKKYL